MWEGRANSALVTLRRCISDGHFLYLAGGGHGGPRGRGFATNSHATCQWHGLHPLQLQVGRCHNHASGYLDREKHLRGGQFRLCGIGLSGPANERDMVTVSTKRGLYEEERGRWDTHCLQRVECECP